MMGFSPVVLCGVPLEPGGYANAEPCKMMRDADLMAHYRAQIARDTAWHDGVIGMSGWPRRYFGGE